MDSSLEYTAIHPFKDLQGHTTLSLSSVSQNLLLNLKSVEEVHQYIFKKIKIGSIQVLN